MPKTPIHRAKGRTPRAHAVAVRIPSTLAEIRTRIRRGPSNALARSDAHLGVAGDEARRGRLRASSLALLLKEWPGALTTVGKLSGLRNPDTTSVLDYMARQLEAAFRDDDDARKWWADLLPAVPTRPVRRKNVSKQGRANPLPDSEWLEAHRAFVTWCGAVREASRALCVRLTVTLPPAQNPHARDERARVVRLLARHLAVADPALRDHHLLADVLNAPARTAQRLTVEALAQRAAGYDGTRKLAKLLTAEKARRLADPRLCFVRLRIGRTRRPAMT